MLSWEAQKAELGQWFLTSEIIHLSDRVPSAATIVSEVHCGVILQRHLAGSSFVVSLPASCLFGIHTPLKDSAKPYLAAP